MQASRVFFGRTVYSLAVSVARAEHATRIIDRARRDGPNGRSDENNFHPESFFCFLARRRSTIPTANRENPRDRDGDVARCPRDTGYPAQPGNRSHMILTLAVT